MSFRPLSQQIISIMLVMLTVVGCVAPMATPDITAITFIKGNVVFAQEGIGHYTIQVNVENLLSPNRSFKEFSSATGDASISFKKGEQEIAIATGTRNDGIATFKGVALAEIPHDLHMWIETDSWYCTLPINSGNTEVLSGEKGDPLSISIFMIDDIPGEEVATPTSVLPASTPILSTVTSVLPTSTPLSPTRLDVTSIPIGSEVYVASVSDLGIKLSDQDNKDATTRRLLGLDRAATIEDMFKAGDVVNHNYRQGVTPLSLPLEPGNYIVFIEIPSGVKITDDELDNLLDWLERDSAHGQRLVGLMDGHNGVAYLVEIIDGKINHLTQLWQSKKASLDEIEQFYPEKETFPLDEQSVIAQISESIPETDLPAVIRLLRKGGKVVYRHGDKATIIEIDLEGKVQTLLTYQDK